MVPKYVALSMTGVHPTYIICIFLLDIVGRRILLGGLMIIGGIVCISAMLLNQFGTEENQWMFEMAKWLRDGQTSMD